MGLLDRFQAFFQSDKVDVSQRFELLREAVSGTMSNFYMARDRKTGNVVGLKIADREKLTLFESRFKGLSKPPEGEIAMQLDHPHIVKTLEHGWTTTATRYMVMEYVPGPGVHVLLHGRDAVLEGQRLKIVRQMAEALDAVHKAGFIHRDVCPRNYIYNPEGRLVKMIDFGLTLPARKEFMQPGNRTGTPLYMAPEVVRRRWTDQRLDIFALGVSAYHVCTYELPWPVSEITGKAALAHDTQEPTDILHCRPTLNRTLAKAIMQCIRPNPNDRPQTVEAFLRAIRPCAGDDE